VKPRFLIDEQLPPALAARLAELGHDAEHVLSIGLGGAKDGEIWAACTRKNAVLITKDEDFAALARQPGAACAVIWLRLGNTTSRALWSAVEPILADVLDALEAGEMLIELA
jgi:predicted nuclease of predicted toxin-antitoxin system